jgi:hypothetical protein
MDAIKNKLADGTTCAVLHPNDAVFHAAHAIGAWASLWRYRPQPDVYLRRQRSGRNTGAC